MAAENHELAQKYRPELSIDDVVDVETAIDRYQHFDRYEVVDPWDNDSRLLATMTGGSVTVAQELDDGSHLVTLDYDDLNAMVSDDCGKLNGHPGEWTKTGRTAKPLSRWERDDREQTTSQVIAIYQQKFTHEHVARLTVVDAAELLAHFEWGGR